jgi:hypothetical protein
MRRGIDYKGAADRPPRSCWSQLAINLRPLSQVPRWDTLGSTRLQGAGALVIGPKI